MAIFTVACGGGGNTGSAEGPAAADASNAEAASDDAPTVTDADDTDDGGLVDGIFAGQAGSDGVVEMEVAITCARVSNCQGLN